MSEINSIPMPTNKNFKDLTGQVFSRLTVSNFSGVREGKATWICTCSCGNTLTTTSGSLGSGNTRSCGCINADLQSSRRTTYEVKDTPEYVAWANMWQRCTNPKRREYQLYVNRRPPDEWRNFLVFLEDVGPRPGGGMSLDRIDNDKPYGPGNCRWATPKEQNNNTNSNVDLTYGGVTLNIKQWAERLGIGYRALYTRVSRGWSVERALTEPVR